MIKQIIIIVLLLLCITCIAYDQDDIVLSDIDIKILYKEYGSMFREWIRWMRSRPSDDYDNMI